MLYKSNVLKQHYHYMNVSYRVIYTPNTSWKGYRVVVSGLTVLNDGAYLTFKSIFHKDLIHFSLIMKSSSSPFLETFNTKQ